MLKKYTYYNEKSDLYNKYPKLLQNDINRPIMTALDLEVDYMKSSFKELINQFFVDTATWALDDWEHMLCMNTDYKLSYETRRSNIKAEMRRREVTTVEAIKKVSEAYSNGECAVIEDYAHYTFTIKFIGTRGIPDALPELDKVICKMKPAHLRHKYEYSYLIWDEFDAYNKTWDEWDALNLTWDELETLNI